MNISPRSSLTIGQLAQLYNGNPNVSPDQVGSNIFLGSSQGADYLQQQGQNLGIGDPQQYFEHQRLAQQAAATPSGGTMEAQRLAGLYSPQSLPGQLAAHQAQINGIIAGQVKDQQLAGLQNQTRLDQQYPLPTPGVTPTLSPVMQAAMAQQGGTDPAAFLMNQRLGGNRSAVASFNQITGGQVKPEDLYHEPTFQAALNNNPQKASEVFSALTGGNLASYHKNYLDAQVNEQKFRDEALRQMFVKGEARPTADGGVEYAKKVFDPVSNSMKPTGEFEKGNPFQQLVGKSMSRVAPEIDRFHQLAAKGGPSPNATPLASLQQTSDNGAPEMLQTGVGQGGVFGNTVTGALSDVSRLFQGDAPNLVAPALGQNNTEDFFKPTGSAVTHAAPLLRNNRQFQALMKRDPAKARAVIMAIQMGNNSPMEPNQDAFGQGTSY